MYLLKQIKYHINTSTSNIQETKVKKKRPKSSMLASSWACRTLNTGICIVIYNASVLVRQWLQQSTDHTIEKEQDVKRPPPLHGFKERSIARLSPSS